MKRILTSILMAAGIAGPFVAHVAAQDNHAIADIPFAFIANKTTMPAGRYQLTQWDASAPVFVLRNATGRTIFVPLGSQQDGKPNKPSVTFACYDKKCVLAKITPPGSLTAYSLRSESVERSLHYTLGIASMVSIKLGAR